MWIALLRRLSGESVEWQTSHGQAIMGTPCEVPVPKKVMRIGDEIKPP